MREYLKFYVDGQWVDPIEYKTVNPINPATEEPSGSIALGGVADVDRAAKAARKAFKSWSRTTREERVAVLERILAEYQKRSDDLAKAVTEEMGAPKGLQGGSLPARLLDRLSRSQKRDHSHGRVLPSVAQGGGTKRPHGRQAGVG